MPEEQVGPQFKNIVRDVYDLGIFIKGLTRSLKIMQDNQSELKEDKDSIYIISEFINLANRSAFQIEKSDSPLEYLRYDDAHDIHTLNPYSKLLREYKEYGIKEIFGISSEEFINLDPSIYLTYISEAKRQQLIETRKVNELDNKLNSGKDIDSDIPKED